MSGERQHRHDVLCLSLLSIVLDMNWSFHRICTSSRYLLERLSER